MPLKEPSLFLINEQNTTLESYMLRLHLHGSNFTSNQLRSWRQSYICSKRVKIFFKPTFKPNIKPGCILLIMTYDQCLAGLKLIRIYNKLNMTLVGFKLGLKQSLGHVNSALIDYSSNNQDKFS